ncbi:MAG: hypothetical protein H6Q28_454 [Bacteroidetes bacterium]|nr:hypothetical protein [Bacteroidota bacterium]
MPSTHHTLSQFRPQVAAAVFLAALGVAGCFQKPIEPVAPTWDVSITAPVTRRSYNLGELSEKDPTVFVSTPGTGDMMFRTSGSAAPRVLGDLLGLRALDVSGDADLGAISVAPFQQTLPVQVPGLIEGSPVPLISSLSLPAIQMALAGFQSLTLEGGTLELRLQNNLPAEIVLESPLVLRDSAGSVVCTFVFSPSVVPAGQTRSATAPLNGATLSRRMSLTGVVVSTSGSTAPVGAGDHIRATLSGSGMLVARAVLAAIPPQTIADNATVVFPLTDSTLIALVSIGSGTMRLDAASEVAVPAVVRFRFEDLYAPSGQKYTDSIALPAFGTGSRTISMTGMTLRSADGSLLSDLRVVSTVALYNGSGGNPVTLSRDDHFTYRLQTSAIMLDSMVGVLRPTAVPIDDDIALDWGDLGGNFRASMVLPSATLQFVPSATASLPLLMDLRIEAARPNGEGAAVLPFPTDAFKTDGAPVVFDQGQVGSFLAQIVEDLPSTVRLAGSVVLNPYYDTSRRVSLGRNSSVGGGIDLGVPLTLSIRGGAILDTAVIGDTTSDGSVDRWLDEETLEALSTGQITIDVENALPLAFTLKFALLDIDGRPLLDLPQATVDSIRVIPAVTANGAVVSPSRSQAVLELQADDVRRVNPARYLRFAVNLQTPGPGLVTFRASDRLTIRSWARFSYRVDP